MLNSIITIPVDIENSNNSCKNRSNRNGSENDT